MLQHITVIQNNIFFTVLENFKFFQNILERSGIIPVYYKNFQTVREVLQRNNHSEKGSQKYATFLKSPSSLETSGIDRNILEICEIFLIESVIFGNFSNNLEISGVFGKGFGPLCIVLEPLENFQNILEHLTCFSIILEICENFQNISGTILNFVEISEIF